MSKVAYQPGSDYIFLNTIWNSKEEDLNNLKKEMQEVCFLFNPYSDEIKDDFSIKLDNSKKTQRLQKNKEGYWISGPTIIDESFNYRNIIELFVELIQNNEDLLNKWNELLNKYEWLKELFDKSKSWFDILFFFIFNVFLREETVEESFNSEWEEFIDIRNLTQYKVKKYFIQNLRSERFINLFEENIFKNEEIRCNIRHIKAEEIERYSQFYPRLPLYNPRLQSLIEIIYPVPEDGKENKKELVSKQEEVNKKRTILFQNINLILSIISAKDFRFTEQKSEYMNKYRKVLALFEGFTLKPPSNPLNFKFFTEDLVLTEDIIQNIIKIIKMIYFLEKVLYNKKYKGKGFLIHYVREKITRINDLIQVNNYLALILIWTTLESLTFTSGTSLPFFLAHLSGKPDNSQKDDEHKFWDTIRWIRNEYVHGNNIDRIEQSLTKLNHNIESLVLITREKFFRIILFLLYFTNFNIIEKPLSPKKYNYWNEIKALKNRLLLGEKIHFNFLDEFFRVTNEGTENELGKSEKFRPFSILIEFEV